MGPKNGFLSIQTLYLTIYMVEIIETFHTFDQTSLLQDLRLYMSKNILFLKFGTCTRNGNLERFRCKDSQKPLGVNPLNTLVLRGPKLLQNIWI